MLPGLRLSDIRGSSKLVAWYYRLFAKEYTVYMIDRKDSIRKGADNRSLAEDTAAVMKRLKLRDVYLFAASQGGMIAQELAIRHPELVKKLVLGVTLSRSNDTVRAVIAHWKELAATSGLAAVAEDYMYKGFSEKYIKKNRLVIPLALKLQRLMPARRFITLAEACLTCETYDELDKLKCPVLVLGGGRDKVVTGEASREIAERLSCPCHIYEDLSHEAYNEAKDFNKRIYDFFADGK
ncbi:MAG: alpha/beta hydrolase [Ruminococcus sp.]|nr:alpha/beta hydrolase [Ruminococcus sp.]